MTTDQVLVKLIEDMADVIAGYQSMKSVDGHNDRPYNPRLYLEREAEVKKLEDTLQETSKRLRCE